MKSKTLTVFIGILVACTTVVMLPNLANAKEQLPLAVRTLLNTTQIPMNERIMTSTPEIRDSLICLALNVYHEARGSTKQDQLAVAEVTINRRIKNDDRGSLCGVVYQTTKVKTNRGYKTGYQFSWTKLPPSMQIPKDQESWNTAQEIAVKAASSQNDITGGATHYFSPVSLSKTGTPIPKWVRHGKDKKTIGQHTYMQLP